jgi:hypothetical protein
MVNVCVPALPPIEATIGIKIARATISSIVASKNPITRDARTAVNRLINNQEKRPLETLIALSVIFSSPTPPSNFISSPASSCITSTISSAVITPISLPLISTTGAETRSNLSNSKATISLSKSALIVTK